VSKGEFLLLIDYAMEACFTRLIILHGNDFRGRNQKFIFKYVGQLGTAHRGGVSLEQHLGDLEHFLSKWKGGRAD
jgi:hypothetical protein